MEAVNKKTKRQGQQENHWWNKLVSCPKENNREDNMKYNSQEW